MDQDKAILHIETSTSVSDLKQWIENAKRRGAREVERAAFKRLVNISATDAPGSLENDFWQTIIAFELVLSDERGRTTRLSRTRQKVARVGENKTLEDWALGPETDGFKMLIERQMPELAGEAIVLRHPDKFTPEAIAAATTRLQAAGVDTGGPGFAPTQG